MFINLNLGTFGLIHTPFGTLVALVLSRGFGGIDIPVNCLAPRTQALTARKRLEDNDLQWGLAPLPCDFLQVDDAGFEASIETLKRQRPFIEARGCTGACSHVCPGSNERDFAENFAWYVRRLNRLGALLACGGVRLGIEFLGPHTPQNRFRFPFIRDLIGALTFIEALDTPWVSSWNAGTSTGRKA